MTEREGDRGPDAGGRGRRRLRWGTATVAILFGVATLVAGGRVLSGGDPGYRVFAPLLVFNTVMGGVYVAAGALIWRGGGAGRSAAGVVALVNGLVLVAVVALFLATGRAAVQSVGAMTLRTAVWAGIWLLLRRGRASGG